MYPISTFPSVQSYSFSDPVTKGYTYLGVDVLTEEEKTILMDGLKNIVKNPEKDLDLSRIFTVQVLANLFVSGLINPNVRCRMGKLVLQFGANYIDLNYDSKTKEYSTLAGKPLQIASRVDQNSNITYPYFQLATSHELARFDIRWKSPKEIDSVKSKLYTILTNGDSIQLDQYIESPLQFGQPLYTLVRGCDLPSSGAHYRIIDVDRKESNLENKTFDYFLFLDPAHIPPYPIWDSKGEKWQSNKITAIGNSEKYLSDNWEGLREKVQNGEYWLIISSLNISGEPSKPKHQVTHVVFPKPLPPALKEFRPLPPKEYIALAKGTDGKPYVPQTVKSLTAQAETIKA